MRVSLLLSTYNWTEALELTLRSVARQSEPAHEVLVADDGSRDDTRALIGALAAGIPAPVVHVWHEDRGFRLGAIRNRALARASGDYVVQTDGDVILHRHFLRDHRRVSRAGAYVRGTRVLLDEPQSRELLDHRSLTATVWRRGVRKRRNAFRCPPLTPLLAPIGRAIGVYGSNLAYWLADAVRVNGYDERLEGWGREDDEFIARLGHAGVRQRNLRCGGVLYHIHHPSRPVDRLAENDRVLAATRREGRIRCEQGLAQYAHRD